MPEEVAIARRGGDTVFDVDAFANPSAAGRGADAEIVTIRPDETVMTKQRLPYFVGVGQATAGAAGISMNLVVIPPGAAAEPHFHKGFETAIYILQGTG